MFFFYSWRAVYTKQCQVMIMYNLPDRVLRYAWMSRYSNSTVISSDSIILLSMCIGTDLYAFMHELYPGWIMPTASLDLISDQCPMTLAIYSLSARTFSFFFPSLSLSFSFQKKLPLSSILVSVVIISHEHTHINSSSTYPNSRYPFLLLRLSFSVHYGKQQS